MHVSLQIDSYEQKVYIESNSYGLYVHKLLVSFGYVRKSNTYHTLITSAQYIMEFGMIREHLRVEIGSHNSRYISLENYSLENISFLITDFKDKIALQYKLVLPNIMQGVFHCFEEIRPAICL